MLNFARPAVLGLLLVGLAYAHSSTAESEYGDYSHDEALAHSQAALGRQLQGIELTGVDGEKIALESYRGKPLLISMVFSSCHYVCPTTTKFLAEVVDKARSALGEDSFHVATVGFDVISDTPTRMGQLQRELQIETAGWDFLSGNAAAIAALSEQLGFIYYPSPRGFDHLIQVSVVDAEGIVYRQVYGMSFPTPVLVEPLKQLVFGESAPISALAYLENRVRLFCTVYDPATDTYHVDISVFIGTFVGLLVSLVFGRVLILEWRKSLQANR